MEDPKVGFIHFSITGYLSPLRREVWGKRKKDGKDEVNIEGKECGG